jgi:drug/metabolite transporter (DMT)-like permease
MNNNLKGFAYGIATSVTFGLIPLFTLPLMEKGMRFDSILFYRFLFAAIALSGMLLAKKESFRTEMRNLPILILLGAFYTGSAMFLFWGYNFMAAGHDSTFHLSDIRNPIHAVCIQRKNIMDYALGDRARYLWSSPSIH